jgi:hypothetical protein
MSTTANPHVLSTFSKATTHAGAPPATAPGDTDAHCGLISTSYLGSRWFRYCFPSQICMAMLPLVALFHCRRRSEH